MAEERPMVGAMRAALAARESGLDEDVIEMVVAIALAESRGEAGAVGDTDIETKKWGPSVGLTQIRTLRSQRGTGGPRDIDRLYDPVENMRAAGQLLRGERFSSGGRTWYEPGGPEQWSTFADGSYEDWLPLARDVIEIMKDLNLYDRLDR